MNEHIIQPIKTIYKNQLFMSRLKARWAVYFDELPIEWVYRPMEKHFPDFYLPQVGMFAEVNPTRFTQEEMEQNINFVNEVKKGLLMLIGSLPKYRPYYAIKYYDTGAEIGAYPYAISNYHNYPKDENRFYFCMGNSLYEEGYGFDDVIQAIHKSRRYEFEKDLE